MNSILKYLINVLGRYVFFGEKIKKSQFKKMVQQVMIEISSACNRKCIYCPHSLALRKSNKMDNILFEKILYELKSISYKNNICLNIYNEPLFFYDDLIGKISKIRTILPKVTIFFSTNGDLLTHERLDELEKIGLDKIIITQHPKNAFEWKTKQVKQDIQNIAEKLKIQCGEWQIAPNCGVHFFAMMGNMSIEIFSLNFLQVGNDRGGVLSTVEIPDDFQRASPCQRVLHDFTISFDGSVYPCCQFFHGLPQTQRYYVGNVAQNSIFDIFFNQKMCAFRKMASSSIPKGSPCSTCRE